MKAPTIGPYARSPKKTFKRELEGLCSNSEARILGQDAGARRSRRGIGPLGLPGSFWGSAGVLGFRGLEFRCFVLFRVWGGEFRG